MLTLRSLSLGVLVAVLVHGLLLGLCATLPVGEVAGAPSLLAEVTVEPCEDVPVEMRKCVDQGIGPRGENLNVERIEAEDPPPWPIALQALPREIVRPQLQAGGLGGLGGLGGRSGATRGKLALEGGGNAVSEAAVALGLQWLALHQNNDGSWSLTEYNKTTREKPLGQPGRVIEVVGGDPDPNAREDRITATAFALLPFLGVGQTHKVSKEENVDYSKTVRGGLDWLLKQQTKEGVFAESVSTHALATLVVCEAYGMTSDPLLQAAAQNAVKHLLACQHEAGGWHETPKAAGDLTVTGWAMSVLHTAQLAGLPVPKEAFLQVDRFLESVYDETAFGFKATPESRAVTASTTAIGVFVRLQRGMNPRNAHILKAIPFLEKEPPAQAMKNLAYALVATQVSYHVGGTLAETWNVGPSGTGRDGMRDLLSKAQDKGVSPKKTFQAGSWASPEGESRLIATAQSLLMLEVYYRHLPMYRRDLGVRPEAPK